MPTKTFFDLNRKKRDRIYNAALSVFSSEPYEKASIQSIIDLAGIPRGSFYQYFTDKEDLFIYCLTEVCRKSIEITYQEDMDFLWNRIYSSDFFNVKEISWYKLALERVYHSLSDNEKLFFEYTGEHTPPYNLLRASYCNSAEIYYPLYQARLAEMYPDTDTNKRNIFAFFLSLIDFYIYESERITGCPRDDIFPHIAGLLRILIDNFRNTSLPNTSHTGNDMLTNLRGLNLMSLHLSTGNGTDFTAYFLPKASWQEEKISDSEDCVFSILIDPFKAEGYLSIPLSFKPEPAHKEETSSGRLLLRLPFHHASETSVKLNIILNGQSYPISSPTLIGIGTTQTGKKICLIEHGQLLI